MATEANAATAIGAEELLVSPRRSIWQKLAPWRRRPMGVFGAIIILFVIVVAVSADVIAPYKASDLAGDRLLKPSLSYPLGTNNFGQDVFSRTIYGAQVSIAVGLTVALLAVSTGTFLGIISGYVGGWPDLLIQRVLEILASFPGLILALIVIAAIGRPLESGNNIFLLAWQLRSLEVAVALAFVFTNMRIVRSATLTERNLPYIDAARSIGATHFRIVFRHILPNVFAYVIISFSVIIGIAILIEAALSFLGYGVSISTPSWGIDLSTKNRQYFLEAPWLMLGPGLAISLTVLGFNFLGDALRDILDPRLRGSR
jgi:peptide/nickel transport system permease protein